MGTARSGTVRRGMAVGVWSGTVGHGRAVMVGHVSVRYVWVRCGLSRRSGSGWVRHGLVRRGAARQGKAVKLINKWWAVVAHYTNIRNFWRTVDV